MTKTKWIGFDLGGTKMLAAVLDSKKQIIETVKRKTPTGLTPEQLLNEIEQTILEVLRNTDTKFNEIIGIGMGVPGPVDSEGVIVKAPNLGVENFPLQKLLEDKLSIPVAIENDVNAGIYAEYKLGAAKGKKHVVGVSPGTGVGGAVIIDGNLLRGARGCGAEIGHMIIQIDGPRCGCGLYGDIEAMCSRSSLSKEAVHLAGTGQAPTIFEKAGTDYKKVKSSLFKKSIENGDEAIEKLVMRSAAHLGIGLGSLVTLFDPEVIVIGGGLVEKLGSLYVKKIRQSMLKHTINPFAKDINVVEAELGDHAVFIGAISLLEERLNS